MYYNPCENCEHKKGKSFNDCHNDCLLAMVIKCHKDTIGEQYQTIERLKNQIRKYKTAKAVIIAAAKEIR